MTTTKEGVKKQKKTTSTKKSAGKQKNEKKMTSIEKRRQELLSRATACDKKKAELERGKGADINRFLDWFKRWRRKEVLVKEEEEIEAAVRLATAASISRSMLENLLDEKNSEYQQQRFKEIEEVKQSFIHNLRELSKEARNCRKKARALKPLATSRYNI